jgi:hypothetical protein
VAISFVQSNRTGGAGSTGADSTHVFQGGAPAIAVGDLAIIAWSVGATTDKAPATPSGYTEAANLYSNNTVDANLVIWYKILDSADVATPQVLIPQSGNNADGRSYAVYVFRGVDQTTPFDVATQTATGTGTTAGNPPSITPTTAGAWIVVAVGGAAGTGAVYTNPGDLSSTTDHFQTFNGADTNDATIGVGLKTNWVSGAFDPAAFGGGTGSGSWAAVTMALRPAPAPQDLTPSLFTNSQSFYGPTITTGSVALTPSLFTNSQTFHAPTVIQDGGAQNLDPALFTNSQSFYGPTITTGAVTLTPSLVTNTNTFYSPTIGLFLTPSLFTNTNTFYAATVTSNYTLAPSLLTDGDNFFSPTVAPGEYRMLPDLFTNSQTFYTPEVVVGPVDLTATLFVNKVGDSGSGSQFFSHYIERVPFHAWTASNRFKRGKPFI